MGFALKKSLTSVKPKIESRSYFPDSDLLQVPLQSVDFLRGVPLLDIYSAHVSIDYIRTPWLLALPKCSTVLSLISDIEGKSPFWA